MSEEPATGAAPEGSETARTAPSASFSRHEEIGRAVSHTEATGVFFGSLMAGFLLGMVGDHFLDTRPLLIVLGIIAGAVIGFWRMWHISSQGDQSGR